MNVPEPPMSAWRTLIHALAKNPISLFAVFCVACTAGFLAYMSDRMLGVLESSDWCAKAIQADRITPGSTYLGLTTCVDLLKIQLMAVAKGFHTGLYAYAGTLLVLVIVVIAGARAAGKIGSAEFDISRQDAVEGAVHVEEAAHQAADEVKGG